MLENLSRKGLFHLFIVYTVWSTTYLGMRVGVDPANGFRRFCSVPCAWGRLR